MTPLFDAGRQGTKVRMVQWVVCGFGLLMFWLATLQQEVLPPPEVETATERVIAKTFAAAVGFISIAAILIYGRCYIGRIEELADGSLAIRTVWPLGASRLVIRPEEVRGSRYHDGRMGHADVAVNAPWHSVRIQGRHLPLLLDVQGDVLNADRLEAVLKLPAGAL